MYTVLQSQKAVSAYFTSEQILPFGFSEQSTDLYVYISLYNVNAMCTARSYAIIRVTVD